MKFSRLLCHSLLSSVAFFALSSSAVYAEAQQHAEVEADSMEYNEEKATVSAKGHVNITYGERKLSAHEVEYDQNADQINATTNIHLTDEYNNEYFADSANIKGDLTSGEVFSLSGHLAEKKALFSADKGVLEDKNRVILDNAAYTPCKVCPRVNDGKAMWRLTADKVTMNREEGYIDYRDATLDVFDVPILYLPYFSHPTPEVKRRSGFLAPSYGQISTLGVTVQTPYFWNIAPNMDLTFAPIFTTEEGIIATGDFRHKTENGKYEIKGSLTNPKSRDLVTGNRLGGYDLRGHIDAVGQFDLSKDWVWGFDAKRSTDRTYLDRYNFSDTELLTSKAYLQNIQGRNYVNIRTVSFQGLQENDNNDITPLILPQVISHHEKKIDFASSKLFFDTNSLMLTRDTGAESRRISTVGGIEIPFTTPNGHVFKIKGSVRGDAYSVENVLDRAGVEKDGLVGRLIPEAQISWNYPLFKDFGESRLFIEPLTDIIFSPNGGNPDKISNEDSQALELSDINLFSNNHFSGVDRVEGGFRSNYGFRGTYTHAWADLGFLFGQSYRAKIDNNFTTESGLDEHFSDYVGRLTLGNELLEVFYRFRADNNDFQLHRNEIGAALHHDTLSASLSYTILDEDNEAFDRQEITATSGFKINDKWSISGYGRRDVTDNKSLGGWIDGGVGIVFENECLRIVTGWNREFTRDADIEPSTSYTLKVSFKGLGQ